MIDLKRTNLITAEQARRFQQASKLGGDILVWRLYEIAPGRFGAQPFMYPDPLKAVPIRLEAPTLDELRDQLPDALLRSAETAVLADALEAWVSLPHRRDMT